MIQTFSADRADQAFHVSALPGRSRCAENFFDIHDFDLFAELLSVDPITISQQIFRCGVEGKGFEHLLRGPFRSRMGCHVEVNHTPAIMDEHNEDKQNFKPHSVHGEEVYRSQLRYVIVEERSPRLRRWLRMADHIFGNRSLRDLNSEFEQFTVESEAHPKEGSHGSLFLSDREFPSELGDVQIAHDVLSKSKTTGILDGAS